MSGGGAIVCAASLFVFECGGVLVLGEFGETVLTAMAAAAMGPAVL